MSQERQNPIVPPPLSIDPLSAIDRLGPTYPTPSTAVLPSIPRSPQESLMSNSSVDGRIYRFDIVIAIRGKMADPTLQQTGCRSAANSSSDVWFWG